MSEQSSGDHRGFIWGQIYIVLAIVFGVIGIIYGILGLVAATSPNGMELPVGMGIWTIAISALWLISGIGIWGRWKWGLWLTYLLLFCQLVGTIIWLILFLVYTPLAEIPIGLTVGRIIAALIHILIVSLWWGYFVRRHAWFR